MLVSSLPGPIGSFHAAAATYPTPQAIEDAFLTGLRALQSGDTATAIRLFRSILAEHPDLPRVRLELARAYFEAREWERSRREFFAVLSGGVDNNVRARIISFLRAIDARRGFDWNLSVGFSASPQALRSYDSETVLVDFFGVPLPFEIERDDSGEYGVAASGSAEYRVEIPGLSSDAVRVTGFGQGLFDVFEGNGSGADDYLFGGALGLRGAWPQTTVSGSVLLTTRDFGGEHFEDRLTFRGTGEWRSLSGISLFSSGSVGLVDDDISDFRDGTDYQLRLGVAKSLGGRAIAGFALTGEYFDADADFETYTTLGAELFGTTDLGFGIDTTGRLFVLNQDYDERSPVLFESRNEWEYGLDVEFTKTDFFLFNEFSPFVSIGYSRRDSTIDAFSYNEYRFNIGFRRVF